MKRLEGAEKEFLRLILQGEKQQEVLARRYGLRGFDRETLEEVGKAIGLTRERVRQIQFEALRELRDILKIHGIDKELIRE